MLRNIFPKPRWKTYAAQSGYVYQYIFEGQGEDHQYVFRAISGSQLKLTLQVQLEREALDRWTLQNRDLTEIERYGIAKMALMRALDLHARPESPIRPEADEIEAICRELDL